MLIIGLTGGVASGKNFVADQFKKLKIPVFDADEEVHKLFASNKKLFDEIKINFPKAIVNGKIDRKILGAEVFKEKEKLNILENIIYPILRKEEDEFIKNHRQKHCKMVVLNIPLLFEKGGYKRCDKTIAVVCDRSAQFARFKQRFEKNSDEGSDIIHQRFLQIVNNQISNKERQKRADIVIDNNLKKSFTIKQVRNITKMLLAKEVAI